MADKKKSFKTESPFITEPKAEEAEENKITLADFKTPANYRLVKEVRSVRVQLTITETISRGLKSAAATEGISLNELCNRIFEDYLNLES